MNQPIQCTEEDLQELKRLALAVRAVSDDDDALGVALDEYDEHANPDQVLVLFTKIDELTGKVGNMVCAKRQMDEELEIARDDLLIFKSAVSAIGEASKKLVVCARTTGGTAGPDQGLMDACAGVEGVITLGGIARAVNEFERLTAERDALQLLLNAEDERVDVLESALKFYADRDHYSVDDGLNWDSCSGEPASILWHESEPWFVEDGSIARSVLAESADPMAPKCTYCGDTGQVMTGRSGDATDGNAPTMEPCEDCIPDFTPGNGNKARRRADSLGLKIPPAPSAYDGFDNGTD